MNQLQTRGIILGRTDYGEADRIVTVLTADHGKLRLMARGVRKPKAKLAGGIELFSVSDITFIRGRGEIGTLISTRLDKHYGRIVQDIDRVQLGYELLKTTDKATEDEPEPEYFELLGQALAALDDASIDLTLIRAWFAAQLLRLAGHAPNLGTTADGGALTEATNYNFDLETMAFAPHDRGQYGANDIKFLRLLFSGNRPEALARVQGADALIETAAPLVRTMLQTHIRL
ncbi:MAG TPA: DNA repair protein RecO [Verrucomicrobiae bacterium]|nr:DNA repair protein RecO [Verrucomicrobiae bacterium]